jgi:uncharacterized membrane protein SpoIIM required for sporulation/ABC-type transport system involved in multi-copper enzyme maturation permease subunit
LSLVTWYNADCESHMNYSTISAITHREVRETLSDWRIVLPIALLTLIFPQLLVFASGQIIEFVEDAALAGRLVPFMALLVGFIPASFSLITALESFVGERERNSLEALLAMPISDRDLYLGKLFSSLITPLISSMLAMLVFIFLLYTFNAELYFAAMTLPRLLQLFLLILLMALTMVSAAVVISSHISSIRAANLMSSFILLPMALLVQWAASLIINEHWETLWMTTLLLALVAAVLVRLGMALFNREEILAREGAQGELPFPRPRFRPRTRPARLSANWRVLLGIVGRELGETLSDWRMLLPVFLLTAVLPVALVSGTRFAVDFVGDEALIGRLLPFAALLVGFVPASFALITALESFVGERERNSLEALLAMPISDRRLYSSKLIAALIVPLLSALLAVTVFLTTINAFFPTIYAYTMDGMRLLQVFAMIGAVTLLMVAAAVVISSHTSSVRAATLLASFVLVPTAVIIQLQALLVIARRWDVLWLIVLALLVIAVGLIRTGLLVFNREEILSREHEQLQPAQILATFSRFFREYQPAGIPPDAYTGLSLSPARFYRHELPALLRELRLPIIVALLGSSGGLLFGTLAGLRGDITAFDTLVTTVGQAPPPSPGLAMSIFANNLRVSLLSNLFSTLSFGAFAFLVPALAFAQVGFVSGRLAELGGSWALSDPQSPLVFLLAYVLPHGIIELPTFILSAALGLRIGAAMLAPPAGFSVGQNLLWALAQFARTWLLLLVPLVLLAALIEGLITPQVIMFLYR